MASPSDDKKTSASSGNERTVLYDKGLQFKRNESYSHALQCFLGCLQDMKEDLDFPELPHCLRNIAEIYSTMGEFEKAIEFVQAEKLFYETALIQAGRKESEENIENQENQTELIDPNASSEDAYLANEYEKLSQMCLKERKIQLALEYAGKATQLRKKIYGDNHEITTKSLNQFTLIYAEMGRQQYSAAMAKISKKDDSDKQVKDEKSQVKLEKDSQQDERSSERKQGEDIPESVVPNKEELNMEEQSEGDTLSVSSGRILFLYFLITLVASLVLTAVLWYFLDTDISTLHAFLLQRMKFYYYYYFNSSVDGIRYV